MSSSHLLIASYFSLVILLDILGNGFVLYATIARRAIKLDKMCLWIIQNLAVVDIANAICIVLPTAISLFAGERWILSMFLCQVLFSYKYSFVIGNILFINVMALNKLLRCLFPLRYLVVPRKIKWTVTGIIVFIMLTGPARKLYTIFGAKSAFVIYSRPHMSCIGYQLIDGVEQYLHTKFEQVISYVFIVAPSLSLIVINTSLIVFAVKSTNRKVNRKNVMVVLLVTLVFIVTFFPFFFVFQKYNHNFVSASHKIRIGVIIGLISSFSNPIIYFFTNPEFRKFTSSSVRWCFGRSIMKTWSTIQLKIRTKSSRIRSLGKSIRSDSPWDTNKSVKTSEFKETELDRGKIVVPKEIKVEIGREVGKDVVVGMVNSRSCHARFLGNDSEEGYCVDEGVADEGVAVEGVVGNGVIVACNTFYGTRKVVSMKNRRRKSISEITGEKDSEI